MSRRGRDAPNRPEEGPATLDLGGGATDAVMVVEVLGRRRCRVQMPSGALLIVPDELLR